MLKYKILDILAKLFSTDEIVYVLGRRMRNDSIRTVDFSGYYGPVVMEGKASLHGLRK